MSKPSLRFLYVAECDKLNSKKNSALVKLLPDAPEDDSLITLDLSINCVGSRGVLSLLPVIENAKKLQVLNLKSNNLTNEAVEKVCGVIANHPSIKLLDLSDNPAVTTAAGKCILDCAKSNERLLDVKLDGTLVRPLMLNCIAFQTQKNQRKNQLPGSGFDAFQFGNEGKEPFVIADPMERIRASLFLEKQEAVEIGEKEEKELERQYSGRCKGRRTTVSSASFDEAATRAFDPPVFNKDSVEDTLITEGIKAMTLFSHLEDRDLMIAVDAMAPAKYRKGDYIFVTGDYDESGHDDIFAVISSGEVGVERDGKLEGHTLKRGDHFGEESLMPCQPKTHSVKVLSNECSLWVLSREIYRNIVTGTFLKKREVYYDFLNKIAFLQCLTHSERIQLADALVPYKAEDGDYLIRYGEDGKWFYILVDGQVEVFGRDSQGKSIKVCDFHAGDTVGELEFMYGHKTVADVISCGVSRAVKMNRNHFELCMGPVVEFLQRNAGADNPTYSYYNSTRAGVEITANDGNDPYSGFKFQRTKSQIFTFGEDGEAEAPPTSDNEGSQDSDHDAETQSAEQAAALQKRFELALPAGGRRKTVSAEVINEQECESFRHEVIPKSKEEEESLTRILAGNALFAHLEDRELQVAVEAFGAQDFKGGHIIFRQHDEADESAKYYLIQHGQCMMSIDSDERVIVREGESFGELELLCNQPRACTIKVVSDTCRCWTLDRKTYRYIMTGTSMKKRKLYTELLKNVSFLKSLTKAEFMQVADALQPYKAEKGNTVISYGEEGMWMYIILEGTIQVVGRDDQGKNVDVCQFGPGATVGELEFIYNHKTVADCIAATEIRAARLDRHHFELCMGPIVDLLKRNASDENSVYDYYNSKKKDNKLELSLVVNNQAGQSGNFSEFHRFSFGGGDNEVEQHDGAESEGEEEREAEMRRKAAPATRRRPTVSGESCETDSLHTFTARVFPKAEGTTNLLLKSLETNYLFKHLDDKEIQVAVQALAPHDFGPGEIIAKQGIDTTEDDTFHIIADGQCTSRVENGGTLTPRGEDVQMKTLNVGDTFGELELMYAQPYTHTITSMTRVRTYGLNRETYRFMVSSTFAKKRTMYEGFLKNISFLKELSKTELIQLADALQPHKQHAGEVLIHYGSPGEWFYLIVEGVVEVLGRDSAGNKIKVCEFKRGDCVGELEFLHNHETVADVVCVTEVRAAKLNRPHFEMCLGPVKELLKRSRESDPVFDYYNMKKAGKSVKALNTSDPSQGFTFGSPAAPDTENKYPQTGDEDKTNEVQRRAAMSAEVYDTATLEKNFQPTVIPKPEEVSRHLASFLHGVALFSHLDDRELKLAVDAMDAEDFKEGVEIVKQGEEGSDESCCYVLYEGTCDTIVSGKVVEHLKSPSIFGETELMYCAPRKCTLTTTSNVKTYKLDRKTYRHIMSATSIRKRRMYEEFLQKVGFLKCMSHLELLQLADALEPCIFQKGNHLINYDEEGQWMYLIVEGVVEVIGRNPEGKNIKVCEFGQGSVVGELEFIYEHRTVADVVALGEVRSARLNRAHFEMCMGPVVDVLKRNAGQDNEVYNYYNSTKKKGIA